MQNVAAFGVIGAVGGAGKTRKYKNGGSKSENFKNNKLGEKEMKKYLLLVYVLLTAFSIQGCSSQSNNKNVSNSNVITSESLSNDQQFITTLSEGLIARWKMADSLDETKLDSSGFIEHRTKIVNCELEPLKKFTDVDFEDKDLAVYVKQYIELLNQSIEAIGYYESDNETYINQWDTIYNERSELINKFVSLYGLTVNEEYASSLFNIIYNAELNKEMERIDIADDRTPSPEVIKNSASPEEQIIYDKDNIKISARNLDYNVYSESGGIGVVLYIENNADYEIHTQMNDTAINKFAVDIRGIQGNSGDLLAGQQGYAKYCIYEKDLEEYNIEKIENIHFKLNVYNENYESVISEEIKLSVDNNGVLKNEYYKIKSVETKNEKSLESKNKTYNFYNIATNLTKAQLTKTDMDNYKYNDIVITSKDEEWINSDLNKEGSVESGALYRSFAKVLVGYSLGNNWMNYAPKLIGFTPSNKEEFEPYVKNAMEFIVTDYSPIESVMRKFESVNSIDGTFDFTNRKYSFTITDLSECASELKISEEMLGYILAMLDEYAPEIKFEENSYQFNLQ